MPFEIVGLDFVGREECEEDMAGVDEVGSGNVDLREAFDTIKRYLKNHGIKDKPSFVSANRKKRWFVYKVKNRYFTVDKGTVYESDKYHRALGAPPKGY